MSTKIAIMGYGTVGSGIAAVLDANPAEVEESAGESVELKYILDLRDFPGDPHEDIVVHDFDVILSDPEVSVLCETMGGVEPAYTFTKKALEAGKSVCTSNKELVAAHGPELVTIAKNKGVSYLFEASVGGGIPILRAINTSLRHEKIESISGILNGTTNYILTKMENEGAPFDEVLSRAQANGYAEKDPTADIEGHDACRKTAILASLMTGGFVHYEDIPTTGISSVSREDIAEAAKMGYRIKLLGSVRRIDTGNKVQAIVAPFLVPVDNPLAAVNDVFNAILVNGNMIGQVMFYGRGAGKEATASAVVADVLDIVRDKGHVPVYLGDSPVQVSADDNSSTIKLASGREYRVLM